MTRHTSNNAVTAVAICESDGACWRGSYLQAVSVHPCHYHSNLDRA